MGVKGVGTALDVLIGTQRLAFPQIGYCLRLQRTENTQNDSCKMFMQNLREMDAGKSQMFTCQASPTRERSFDGSPRWKRKKRLLRQWLASPKVELLLEVGVAFLGVRKTKPQVQVKVLRWKGVRVLASSEKITVLYPDTRKKTRQVMFI